MKGPVKAKVASADGDVRVVSATGDVYEAKIGMELQEGDQLWTADGAKAELNMKGGEGTVKIEEKSSVSLNQEAATPKTEDKEAGAAKDLLRIAFGKVSVEMLSASSESTFSVQTPTGISGQRG